MKNNVLLFAIILLATTSGLAQKYFTRTAKVSFFSEAPTENIEAQNRQVTCILNTENGELAFSVQLMGFHFEKALMEEHFNENYVESHKYPKSTFKGKVIDFENIDIKTSGKHNITVEGDMSLHGETKTIKAKGELTIAGDEILLSSKFDMRIEDYKISIPKAVINKIAESIEVSLMATLTEYKK
jgi:hypothetical protein